MSSPRLTLGCYDWALFFGFFAVAFTLQLIPVILLAVSNDLGFPLSKGGFADGGLIQLFAGITGVLAMISGSFIANKYGKRLSYTVSLVLLFIGFFSLFFADSYLLFVAFMMIAGAGGNLLICLVPTMSHDLHEDDSGKYITIVNSFWSVGMLLTVLLAGFLLRMGYSWRCVVLIGSLSALLPIIIMLLSYKKGRKFPERLEIINYKDTARMNMVVIKTLRFWRFVCIISLTTSSELIIGLWTASYVQLDFKATPAAGGFAVACFAVGMIISRFVSGYFVKQEKIKGFILVYGLAATIVTATFPFIETLSVFYIMLFLVGLAAAPLWPCIQSYSVDQLPELDKTVVLILLTIAGIGAYSVSSWITGLIATAYDSLTPVYYLVPINYLLCIIILLFTSSNTKIVEPAAKI